MTLPINKSIVIAISIALAISLWLLSGLFKEDATTVIQDLEDQKTPKKVHVLVSSQQAIDHRDIVKIYGQTQANRTIEIKAQTAGEVKELLIEKGTFVKKGDVIARLKVDDRNRRLQSAQSAVRFRQLEFEASRKLSQKSFRSQTKLAEAESLLNAAKAELRNAQLDLAHIEIKAPFPGKLDDHMIEVGDYLSTGQSVATLVDLSPIVIAADIPENHITKIADGQAATAILNNGRSIEGIIRYVASTSNSTARTYKVEMEADNPNHEITAGLTAKLHLQVGTQSAYLLSPSILTLSDQGVIGVKTVNATDQVEFHPVNLIEDTVKGIWVSGLPARARIIIRGQEYVKTGQLVSAEEQ
ncbi:efflux RND transporter periplasmic adaptor subunit [Terasakiella sp. SH-1]|uniref:efflux RND transporter periplasmic adaptor subunit n=1 Tax=Terasakiella sp. SH-1 TaxID=2560057 RepID=UPI0010733A8E|nr:efflux RND transporter periplasmic adaptor subunit [Terasakiella sp. SH-1]